MEVTDSFVLVAYLLKFGSFKNPFALMTGLSELYLRFILKIYSVGTNEKSDFYELWQQYNLLKIMEMSDLAWYLPWGIYTYVLTRSHSRNSLAVAEALSLKRSSSGVTLLFEHSTSRASELEHLEIFSCLQGNQLAW